NTEHFADLAYRQAMIIGQVDNGAMLFRQGVDEAPKCRALVLLHRCDFGRVGAVGNRGCLILVYLLFLSLAARRQRLEARDAEQPGRYLRASLEGGRLLPQLQKDFVGYVFGQHLGTRLSHHEAVDPRVVAHEQKPHGGTVAFRDPVNAFAVACRKTRHDRSSRLALKCCVASRRKKVHPRLTFLRKLTEERDLGQMAYLPPDCALSAEAGQISALSVLLDTRRASSSAFAALPTKAATWLLLIRSPRCNPRREILPERKVGNLAPAGENRAGVVRFAMWEVTSSVQP